MEQLGTLLERARAGDRTAFGAIVQSQLGRLYGTAFRIAGDRHPPRTSFRRSSCASSAGAPT